MKREDDQELWDLLGKAGEPPAPSPFFARNVLREIRRQPAWRERLAPWLSWRRLIPATAVAAAVAAATLSLQNPGSVAPEAEPLPEAVAQLDEIDFEVVADLDNLLAMEEDSLWTDGDVSTL